MSDFPTPTQTARQVLANPAAFHDKPAVLASAWATLMEARGNRVHLERLGPPAHQVIPDVIHPLPTTAERVAARVHTHATAQNYPIRRRGLFTPPTDGVPA